MLRLFLRGKIKNGAASVRLRCFAMTLEYFSTFYFVYPALCVALFFILFFVLRGRSKKTVYWVLFALLAVNFVLHFVKLAFPPYVDGLPATIRKATFENICAVSTLVFPFLMLSKKPLLWDYMFYIGVISGFAAMFAPMNIIGLGVFEFETIRFYICHGSLWIAPLLMVLLKVHTLNYRRVFKVILLYFACLFLILFNEIVLMVIGWVAPPESFEGTLWDYFLSNVERNSGFIFGPPPELEEIAQFLLVLTPSFFKPGKYIDVYMPVLWEVVPVLIYGMIGGTAISAIWDHKRMAEDIAKVKAYFGKKFKRARLARAKSRFVRPVFNSGKRLRRAKLNRF